MAAALDVLPYRHVLTLPNEPAAVRLARETAQQALTEWGIGLHRTVVDAALLMLSELVTNSVRHAAEMSPQITVMYAASGSRLALAVHDRHPYQPPPAATSGHRHWWGPWHGHGTHSATRRHCCRPR